MSKLLSPISIKGITLKNRIVMSPMVQYCATDGVANDWHFIHYTTRAIGGCGTILQEATAVSPEGRVTYADLGIWKDEQIVNLKKITTSIEKYGAVPGIQLGHGGRKSSCDVEHNNGVKLTSGKNSWTTVAPSAIAFQEHENPPQELTKDGIQKVIDDFKSAAIRAIEAGYKILEIHAAHGYLIHQFLSPLSNKRTDEYGGSFENRVRLLLQIIDAINNVIDNSLSLWVRISATDWVEGGWDIEQSVKLAALLKIKKVNVIDVSSGGNISRVNIPIAPNYQVPFAERIKKETHLTVGAVGLITEVRQAEELLSENKCDLVFLGRELLRNPYFTLNAARKLGDTIPYPIQYERSFK